MLMRISEKAVRLVSEIRLIMPLDFNIFAITMYAPGITEAVKNTMKAYITKLKLKCVINGVLFLRLEILVQTPNSSGRTNNSALERVWVNGL